MTTKAQLEALDNTNQIAYAINTLSASVRIMWSAATSTYLMLQRQQQVYKHIRKVT
jgi:hypothetical protein